MGGAFGAAEHHHGVFSRHVVLDVVKQAFQLAAPRRKGKSAEIRHGIHGNFPNGSQERVHEHGVRRAEQGAKVCYVYAEPVAAGEQYSLLEKHGNVLVLLRRKAFEHAL